VASGWNRFVAMRKGDFYGTSTGFMPERVCVWRTPDGRAHAGILGCSRRVGAGIPGVWLNGVGRYGQRGWHLWVAGLPGKVVRTSVIITEWHTFVYIT
jgi:hypothetical protein